MTTRKVLDRMPACVVSRIESYREAYKNPKYRDETRAASAGYVHGLKDAGLITERERQILFVYSTV